jgi:hypothetical protein
MAIVAVRSSLSLQIKGSRRQSSTKANLLIRSTSALGFSLLIGCLNSVCGPWKIFDAHSYEKDNIRSCLSECHPTPERLLH